MTRFQVLGRASVPMSTVACFVPVAVIDTCRETRFPDTEGVTVIVRAPAAAPAAVALAAIAVLMAAASPERLALAPALVK